jgi:hypothetical protein
MQMATIQHELLHIAVYYDLHQIVEFINIIPCMRHDYFGPITFTFVLPARTSIVI